MFVRPEDRAALAATLDRRRNSALCEAIDRNAIYATPDGTVLSIDANHVARLSDPSTIEGATLLATIAPATLAMARGPVAAIAAFVQHGRWTRILEAIEMAWLERPELRAVAGEMRCSTELATSFESWRDAFTREVFRDGGSPPAVSAEQLFVWTDGATPRAMAGLLPLGPTGARIVTVYTPPAERGRGYAAALTAALAAHARGCDVTLDVSVDDPFARRAYERAGFRAIGHNAIYVSGTTAA
jgi:ribosomal protein S18 acetylase RimI-like enzyme